MLPRASRNNASRFNEINHLRAHSYRLEYRPTRPVTEPLSHAGSGYFHRYNIQASRPSFGARRAGHVPTFSTWFR